MRAVRNCHRNIKVFVAYRASKKIVYRLKNENFQKIIIINITSYNDVEISAIFCQLPSFLAKTQANLTGSIRPTLLRMFSNPQTTTYRRNHNRKQQNLCEMFQKFISKRRPYWIQEIGGKISCNFYWLKITIPIMPRSLCYVFFRSLSLAVVYQPIKNGDKTISQPLRHICLKRA